MPGGPINKASQDRPEGAVLQVAGRGRCGSLWSATVRPRVQEGEGKASFGLVPENPEPRDLPESACGWHRGCLKLCPRQVLRAGGRWEVGEEKKSGGRNLSAAGVSAVNANTQVHGRTHLELWFDGRWTVERAAGFRHLKLNAVVHVLG